MIDNVKTKAELIKELTDLRKRNAELNALETERKKSEEKLIESRLKLTTITRNIPDIVYRLDQRGVITYISDAVTQYGYSTEELVGRNILEIICPDDKEKAMYRVNERRTGDRRTISFKIRLLKKDYTSISSEVELKGIESEAVFLIYAEGLYSTDKPEKKSFIGTLGIARDITERMQIENEFKEAKGYLQNIFDSSLDMIVAVDKNRRIVEFNKAASETFGYNKEEIVGKHVHILYATEKEGGKVSKLVLKNGVYTGEIQNVRKNGEVFTSFLSAAVMHNENGEIIGTVGNSRDITDRKKADDELRASMANFRSIFDNASDAIFVHDAETGEILDANQRTYEMYGFTMEEIRSLKVPCLSSGEHPYSEKDALRWIKKAVKGKPQLFEWQAKDKNGRLFWVEVNLKRTVIGGADRVLAIARDITERKRAEEALQKSESLYRKTIDSMGDIIHVIDYDFKILLINVKYFNMCKELNIETDVIGKYLFEVCPFLTDTVQKEYYHVFDTGKTHISENEFIIGGRGIITETRKIPVLENDEVKRIVTVIRDITESKNIENELKNSQEELRSLTEYLDMVREKERTTIARDIHDDFGQALTSFKIDLSCIEKYLPEGIELVNKKIKLMYELIDKTIKTMKEMITNLRPSILDDFGLEATLEWYAKEFQNRTEIICDIHTDLKELDIDQNRSTTLFRIFQESLTNVARHANATRINVNVKEEKGNLVLKIEDNGKGITEKQINDSKSFGLIGMRERLIILKGKLKIISVKDKGTTIVATIPLERRRESR